MLKRNFKMFLPYQMKKIEIKSNGHLSNLIIHIISMSQSPTSSLIISCSNNESLQCIFPCLLLYSSSFAFNYVCEWAVFLAKNTA